MLQRSDEKIPVMNGMSPMQFDAWLAAEPARRRPLIMGVLNVTPDSFSDGGKFSDANAAIAHAIEMIQAGAELIDIGGESTRPGSLPVEPDEQIRRVVPVLDGIRDRLQILSTSAVLSIDTTSSRVAESALNAGAHLVNDISAGRADAGMFPLLAHRRAPIVLMHMLGTPPTMQDSPRYPQDDVVAAVIQFLHERMNQATQSGIRTERILLDPGIGFGKTLEHNLRLLRETRRLAQALGRPLVLGASRKRFIGAITDEPEPAKRLFGTAAAVAWSIANGAAVVRVHDVGPMRQVMRMTRAIQAGSARID
jgi:dihydropteroate synthase